MNSNKKYFLPLIIVAIATSLSSCTSTLNSRNTDSAAPTPTTTPNSASSSTPSQAPTVAQLREKSLNKEPLSENTPSSTSKDTTSKTIKATVYTSDTQCQQLVPQKISVPAEEPVTGAVSKILEKRDTSDFSLSGYRVSVKNGIATVDLRLSPKSKRQIASLSSCEQFALFGSLRKTLTSNSQWKIKEVRFTERGQEIVL